MFVCYMWFNFVNVTNTAVCELALYILMLNKQFTLSAGVIFGVFFYKNSLYVTPCFARCTNCLELKMNNKIALFEEEVVTPRIFPFIT